MICIAGFRNAFLYFWIFGIISVFLDLDHLIQVYQYGMEFSLENITIYGTRLLHIPVLIFAGCICLITGALLLRFWLLNRRTASRIDWLARPELKKRHKKVTISMNPMLRLAADALLSVSSPKPKHGLIVECPRCNEYIGVVPATDHTEFPCPNCGVNGYLNIS